PISKAGWADTFQRWQSLPRTIPSGSILRTSTYRPTRDRVCLVQRCRNPAYNPGYAEVEATQIWGLAEIDVIREGMTPEAAAEKALKRIEKILAKYPIAQTVADLTCSQNGTVRQQIIETLMREIMEYDAEFRREDASGAVSSVARH